MAVNVELENSATEQTKELSEKKVVKDSVIFPKTQT